VARDSNKEKGVEMAHPNEELFRQGYDAFATGDMDKLRELLSDDVTWHQPGNNTMSGDFTGMDEVLGLFARLFQETNGTFRTDIHDVLANDTHGVVLAHVTGQRGDKSLDQDYVHVAHFRDGKLTEAWIHNTDEPAADDFWS
jgi:uncharacterized protein